jgi:hypothetical protein
MGAQDLERPNKSVDHRLLDLRRQFHPPFRIRFRLLLQRRRKQFHVG